MARAVEEPSAGVEHCQRDHGGSSEGGVTPDGAIIRGTGWWDVGGVTPTGCHGRGLINPRRRR